MAQGGDQLCSVQVQTSKSPPVFKDLRTSLLLAEHPNIWGFSELKKEQTDVLAVELCSLSCLQNPQALQGPLLSIIGLLGIFNFVLSTQSYCSSLPLEARGENGFSKASSVVQVETSSTTYKFIAREISQNPGICSVKQALVVQGKPSQSLGCSCM